AKASSPQSYQRIMLARLGFGEKRIISFNPEGCLSPIAPAKKSRGAPALRAVQGSKFKGRSSNPLTKPRSEFYSAAGRTETPDHWICDI
ncbi:MAG: hypothetical protein ACREQV_00490, partial [Candidatus Binatia bacterium]